MSYFIKQTDILGTLPFGVLLLEDIVVQKGLNKKGVIELRCLWHQACEPINLNDVRALSHSLHLLTYLPHGGLDGHP